MSSAKKRISVLIATLVMMIVLCVGATTVLAATPAGAITSVSNTSSGVKISWKKDSSKSGYYIYRKSTSSSTWSKIKTVKGGKNSTWTDTGAANGKKYDYKTCAYKGSKKYTNSVKKTIYRLKTPSVYSLSYSGDNIRIKSTSNSAAGGFQIKYSTSSTYSSYKTVIVYGQQANKVLTNLSCSKKYYFKVRAFKTGDDKRYYSGYSGSKTYTTKAPYSRYAKHYETYIYTDTKKNGKTLVAYNDRVVMYQDVYVYSSGTWKKCKYNNKFYYVWLEPGNDKFMTSRNKYEYTNDSNTIYQQEVVDEAVRIVTQWDTEYDYKRAYSDGTVNHKTGKRPFDCSGFIRYVINGVMQNYNRTYVLPNNTEELYKLGTIANTGFGDAEIKASTVCTGSYDFTKLKPGDLIMLDMDGNDDKCDHVGIYLGKREIAHSVGTFNGVVISPMTDAKFKNAFMKAIRVLPTKVKLINKQMTTTGWLTMHPDISCPSDDPDAYVVKATGSTVTLISTTANNKVGYVRYYDEAGNKHLGYVYKPLSKLE